MYIYLYLYRSRFLSLNETVTPSAVVALHVEYAERRTKYGTLFIFRPFYECSYLEYVHVAV